MTRPFRGCAEATGPVSPRAPEEQRTSHHDRERCGELESRQGERHDAGLVVAQVTRVQKPERAQAGDQEERRHEEEPGHETGQVVMVPGQ
jgi:hypothetical protein